MKLRAVWAIVCLVGMLAVGGAFAAGASAESLCTDTWTGPAEGAWETAGDWSAGKAPSSTDVACIGSGVTVDVEPGITAQAGSLQVEGTLVIKGGTLEPTGGLSGEVSVVSTLRQSGGGWLDGAGTVEVTKTFAWTSEGTITGGGRLVLAKGGSGSGNNYLTIKGYTFVNEGEWSFSAGAIRMSEGARFENDGVFYTSEEGEVLRVESTEGGIPRVVNSGLFERRSGPETTYVEAPFENTGRVFVAGGTLWFNSNVGSSSSTSGTWEVAAGASLKLFDHEMSSHKDTWSGPISVGGIVVSELEAKTAQVTVEGTFSVESGASTIEALTFAGGTITGAGTIDVTKSFSWTGKESTMTGSGKTVLEKGAVGTIAPGGTERFWDYLTGGYTLVNEGELSTSYGEIDMSEGAVFKNTGTYYTSAKGTVFFYQSGGSLPRVVNTGLIERRAGAEGSHISVPFENTGRVYAAGGYMQFDSTIGSSSSTGGEWSAASGASVKIYASETSSHNDTWVGSVYAQNIAVSELNATKARVAVEGTFLVESGKSTVETLEFNSGTLTGPGTLDVTTGFSWSGSKSTMTGSGKLVLEKGVTGSVCYGSNPEQEWAYLTGGYTLVNEGALAMACGTMEMSEGALLKNTGSVYLENNGTEFWQESSNTSIDNMGLFEKRGGKESSVIAVWFNNQGTVNAAVGKIVFEHPVTPAQATQYGASRAACGDPVDCLTGNFYESQSDIAVGGRGVGLDLTRTYNAQAAAAGEDGAFGYGWTSSFSAHLTFNGTEHMVTVVQDDGSTVPFSEEGGKLVAPLWTQDKLSGGGGEGYALTLADQTVYRFSGAGRLESVADRDGNTTSLGYNERGQLATITDPSGRKITLAYNAEGLVESATDPMTHVVKYAYEGGQLASVTLPSQTSPRWKFKYDASHRMTGLTDGRGNETTNTYNGANQVTSQKDFMGHVLKWEYEPFKTKITNETTGGVTVEQYTSADDVNSITRGYGTSKATTESFTYNERGEPLTRTDGSAHTTSYEYDSEGNRVKQTDPEGHETTWTYNTKHGVTSETLPSGEKTTIEYDEHGNPIKASRPAPEEKTQETRYEYNTLGELTAMIDPLERKWTYGYDEAGDRTSETDPEGDKTTWAYNKNSVLTSEVSPRGNVTGGEPSKYTTTFTRDPLGRLTKITQPEAQETSYVYNANSNLIGVTDPNGHKTTIGYSLDGLPSKVTEPNGAVTETTYNGENEVASQIDGNKHTTKYLHNLLGEVTEIIDPLEHKTREIYDAAGNLATLVDASGRTTIYSYNKENEPTKVHYSESGTPTVEYGYTPNGQLSSMLDGTGTTNYTYDQLGRLTETKNGHGDTVGYGYDLANEITSVKYPNGKTVKDGYDKAGRLSTVSDWLSHTIGFAYNPDSEVITTSFPEASGESDRYAYNRTDQLTEASMLKGSETLASIAYVRDLNGQATKETQTGLPGEAATEYGYDVNERLTKAGASTYEYDPANNPSKIGTATNTFNADDQLTEGGGLTYAYNTVGQRTKATPTTGPASTYGYNQAGVLTSVNRPEEGSTPKIEDSYTYDGNGLRASETIGGTTKHLIWQLAGGLPLLLNDASNSYIYGPGGVPIEQINSEEHATYLHHDQAGSTRLLSNEKGEVTGSYTYGPYGETTGHTGTATTPLGYDGQYTSSDTGLVYLRARVYDPATAQFLSVDPLEAVTREPYAYAEDNPLNVVDPSGLAGCGSIPILSTICNFGQESGISDAAAGALNFLTFGASNQIAGSLFGFNASCASFGETGTFLGAAIGFFDGEDEAVGLGDVAAGVIHNQDVLGAAERWLGDGYREIAPGVYRSADGTRQFRFTESDLGSTDPHVHFESVGPSGRGNTENAHVYLEER